MISIEEMVILFFIYSFAGWLMESVRAIPREGKFVNRGFLIGPICPIYGWGVILITILLQKYKEDIVVTFFMSILICGILEYMTSYVMEKLFNARWWDYSNRKFNINGRICLETLIPFGILGMIIIYITNPVLLKCIEIIPSNVLLIIFIILTLIYIVDSIISIIIILNLREMKKEFRDNTIEISEKVKNIIVNKSIFHRRMVQAFPNIQDTLMYAKWDSMKNKFKQSQTNIKEKLNIKNHK